MALLAFVAFSPPPGRKPQSAYMREIAPHEKKLVWYKFNEKLPEVSPPKQAARPQPPRAIAKHPSQTIVAKSSRPKPAKQIILAPGPELNVEQELKAPNLMAFEAPKPPEPAPPPKLFMPPPEPPRATDQPVLEAGPALPVAENPKPLEQIPAPRVPLKPFVPPPQVAKQTEEPRLQPGEVRVVSASLDLNPLAKLPLPAKPQPKPFTPPVQTARRTDPSPALSLAAPALAPQVPNAKLPSGLAAESLPARPQPKAFMPPVQTARGTGPSPALADGPVLAPQAPNTKLLAGLPGQGSLPARPQPRIFLPPSRSTAAPSKPGGPALEADGAPASNISAAVVGLNPINTMPVVPRGSRPAQFSAAPKISEKGDSSGSVTSASIKMEDLMISGGGIKKEMIPNESIVALTRIDPTSKENLLAASRAPIGRPAPLAPPKPMTGSPVRVSSAPDKRLDGRVVYTVAINMPNVTSYSGSWILWYAERQPNPGEERQVLPPEPLRKVDPIYDLSAVDDRVEGKVQLSAIIHKDGFVYGINVVRGVDPRLDNNAVQALRKWEFTPASIDGDPVDVDIVIEIPFRLRPLNNK
jgi:TonB family protein